MPLAKKGVNPSKRSPELGDKYSISLPNILTFITMYKIHMDQELITPENVCVYSINSPNEC